MDTNQIQINLVVVPDDGTWRGSKYVVMGAWLTFSNGGTHCAAFATFEEAVAYYLSLQHPLRVIEYRPQ